MEQTDRHRRPTDHTFHHPGWSQLLKPNQNLALLQKKDKFGGWFDALITDDDNCAATIEELEARVPGLSEGKW